LWPGHQLAAQASHAWVELHVSGVGWMGFDPANACRPTDAYVRVAVGLDYFDAPPTRGVRRGGPCHEALSVLVKIDPEPDVRAFTRHSDADRSPTAGAAINQLG
jgi:transglutaminase-like putative cysteine protease